MSIFDPNDPKHARALLRLTTETIVWLTTVTPEGQPNTTPVWFWFDGEEFHLYSRPQQPKLRNLGANPNVTLHLPSDANALADIVVVQGTGGLESDALPADRIPAYIDRYRALIAGYGWTPESFATDYPVAIRVVPTKVRIW